MRRRHTTQLPLILYGQLYQSAGGIAAPSLTDGAGNWQLGYGLRCGSPRGLCCLRGQAIALVKSLRYSYRSNHDPADGPSDSMHLSISVFETR